MRGRLIHSIGRVTTLLLFSLGIASCLVTYRDFPVSFIGSEREGKPFDILSYDIRTTLKRGDPGMSALTAYIETKSPFAATARRSEPPPNGVFCRVIIREKPPGVAASIFGYLSLFTAYFLPSWSLRDGYEIRFEPYVDGTPTRPFIYEITRKAVFWIGLIPLSWGNLFTYKEEEAFEAVAARFFEEADPLFRRAENKRGILPSLP